LGKAKTKDVVEAFVGYLRKSIRGGRSILSSDLYELRELAGDKRAFELLTEDLLKEKRFY